MEKAVQKDRRRISNSQRRKELKETKLQRFSFARAGAHMRPHASNKQK